jgi:hypothetical protein
VIYAAFGLLSEPMLAAVPSARRMPQKITQFRIRNRRRLQGNAAAIEIDGKATIARMLLKQAREVLPQLVNFPLTQHVPILLSNLSAGRQQARSALAALQINKYQESEALLLRSGPLARSH